MKKSYLLSVLLAFFVSAVPLSERSYARTTSSDDEVQKNSFPIYFRIGSAEIDLAYHDNQRSVEGIINMFKDDDIKIDKVEMMATTSPEGSVELNLVLAKKREEAFYKHFKQRVSGIYDKVSTSTKLYTWKDLADIIENDDSLRDRKFILDILRSNDSNKNIINRLRAHDGGRTYKYLEETYLSKMRSSGCVIVWFTPVKPAPVKDTVVIVVKQECPKAEVPQVDTVPAGPVRYPVFAFRTNLLLPLSNIGFEVPIGNRVSVSADFYTPWIPRAADHKNCFQMQGFNADVKYWFGQKHEKGIENRQYRLTGHAVGIFTSNGQYDFEYNYHGYQGEYMTAGLEYTYSLAGKNNFLRWQFTLGLGYMYNQKYEYDVYVDGGNLYTRRAQKTTNNYFGPVKAEIMLVLPIMSTKQIKEESK